MIVPRLPGTSPSHHSIVLETDSMTLQPSFCAPLTCSPLFRAPPPKQLVLHCVEQGVVHLRQVPTLCVSSPQPWWQPETYPRQTGVKPLQKCFYSWIWFLRASLGYKQWKNNSSVNCSGSVKVSGTLEKSCPVGNYIKYSIKYCIKNLYKIQPAAPAPTPHISS